LGAVIDVAGRAGLADFALLHHHHEIGERDCLELGVGDVHEGDAKLALHVAQLLAHLDAQELVERGKRLVEQEHARFGDGGAGERDALLLAAGKLRGQPVREFREPDFLHHGVGGLAALGLGDAAHLQRKGDVVAHVQMREQGVGLEHHGGAARHRRQADDIFAAD
jgi:hypothetical protein